MDELRRSKERLEKLREELHSAQSELEPLKESWRERTDREVEELIEFAKGRGHYWAQRDANEDGARWLLGLAVYGSGFERGGPLYKESEKVDRLEGKVRWWEKKVSREERNAAILALREQED